MAVSSLGSVLLVEVLKGFTRANETGLAFAPQNSPTAQSERAVTQRPTGLTYRHRRSGLWTSLAFEYSSGTPGGHGADDHEDEAEEAEHGHAAVVGGCEARCPSHFTQNLSIGWDAVSSGDRPHVGLQFSIENLTNNVYLISKESTFVQAQYSIPRLFSGSLKFRF